jgi:endoglucanase
MDHPGFVAASQRGRTLWAQFRGGVRKEYFRGAGVVFFTPSGAVKAKVHATSNIPGSRWLRVRLRVRSGLKVPPGTVGMWDLPAAGVRGRRVAARACDDLAGVAAVLAAMADIRRRGGRADVIALLTRAEEAGLVGALAAIEAGTIPRKSKVLAVECSAAQGGAQLGEGAVIRVGDRVRTFEPSLTALVAAAAGKLAGQRKGLRFVRQLMAGGTCESTAYLLWGLPATGLSMPLGNYHNQGPGRRIAPEMIHLNDFESLVRLLIALAACRTQPADVDAALKVRLRAGLRRLRKYF